MNSIAKKHLVNSCKDISNPGVVGTLGMLLEASNMGAEIELESIPKPDDKRSDIIQAIKFRDPELLVEFCRAIQSASPIDSYVSPEPWEMPGYNDKVVMAAGAFVQGSSIELSADGPIKEPYNVYFQGGITFPHGKFGIVSSLNKLYESNLVSLP